MNGIVIVNKRSGMTSHDVVQEVRKKLGMRRVGHAGTLDPLATGVLIILLGKSTKLFDQFVKFDKAYRATLILGVTTTSADVQGEVLQKQSYEHITRKQIEEAFKNFVGEIDQVPPMVSAVKVGGVKLYQLARKGIEIERQPRKIRIDCLKLEDVSLPHVKFYLECSKGTYVRQLADDVGKMLGCGACISQIERTRVGNFCIEDAVRVEEINESHIRNWQG
ncbi:MAG TPA: tRNA pseudouridine(55) synthase TruB [Candidatus Omnitrophica bacterium]|nr:MAG: tRNA pseudouridine(55) synthase TruB [Omnitrophica WOR_2 bacterium GWA2_45_18]HBR15363.1 tRNA pseudouridine(55) synthase TruB [Candidatus Omnitrophota bacterium]